MYGHNGRHFGLAALQKCRFKDHRGEPGAPGPHAPIHNDHTRPPTPPSPDCRHQSPESTHETEPTEVTLDPRGSGLRFFMFIRPQPYTCLGIERLTQGNGGGVVYYFSCL